MEATNLFCLILVSSIPLVEGSTIGVLDIIDKAWSLVSRSIDIGNLIDEHVSDDGDLSDKIKELEHAINDMKNDIAFQLSNLKVVIKEEIFYNYLRGLFDELNSCVKEYEHLKENLHDTGMKANFWNQCKDIITPLRALRNILSGTAVMRNASLMAHLIEKEGFCNSVTMNGTFSYIFQHFAEGFAAFIMAQRYKHGNTSRVYEEEFREALADIKTYMTEVFQNCSMQICSLGSQLAIQKILKVRESLNETLIQLHKQFPYLKFFILRMTSNIADASSPVNHNLKYIKIQYNGVSYRVYAVKSHKVSNERGPLYKLIEYSPSDLLDYKFTDMIVDRICEEGMSRCAFKIYVSGTDANCFHHVVSTGNALVFSLCAVILSVSFGIISSITM